MKSFLLFIIICICVIGCSKKDKVPESEGTVLEKVVLKSHSYEYAHVTLYLYGPNNQLNSVSHVTTEGGPINTGRFFVYNSQQVLFSYTVPGAFTYTFKYDTNGKIIGKTGISIAPIPTKVNDVAYGYDLQNRVIADTTYDGQSNVIVSYVTYTYDAVGNVIQKDNFYRSGTGFTNTLKTFYSYDNKLNPYYSIRTPLFYSQSDPNILSPNNLIGVSNVAPAITISSYTYYSNDLPQTKNTSLSNGEKFTTTFHYQKP